MYCFPSHKRCSANTHVMLHAQASSTMRTPFWFHATPRLNARNKSRINLAKLIHTRNIPTTQCLSWIISDLDLPNHVLPMIYSESRANHAAVIHARCCCPSRAQLYKKNFCAREMFFHTKWFSYKNKSQLSNLPCAVCTAPVSLTFSYPDNAMFILNHVWSWATNVWSKTTTIQPPIKTY